MRLQSNPSGSDETRTDLIHVASIAIIHTYVADLKLLVATNASGRFERGRFSRRARLLRPR